MELQDLNKYFGNSNITIEVTSWKQENRDYHLIFIPLEPNNQPQSCLQKIGNNVTRLDFVLREVDNKLVFNDLLTKKGWHLDLSELHQSKLHLVGQHSRATFLKEDFVNLGASL